MKKTLSILLLLMLLFSLTAAAEDNERAMEDLNGKTVVFFGDISSFTPDSFYDAFGVQVKEIITVPTALDAIAALKSGRADYMTIPKFTAEYFAQMDDSLGLFEGAQGTSLYMVTRASDNELLEDLNAAIAEATGDGTAELLLDQLKGVTDDSDTGAASAPPTSAVTLNVGISGDMPPLDFIASDGTPRGFSVAFMNVLAEKMGVNIEFVPIATEAKLTALMSSKIDIFFWQAVPFVNDEIAVSEAYINTDRCWLYVK